jgi:hypothetical protein
LFGWKVRLVTSKLLKITGYGPRQPQQFTLLGADSQDRIWPVENLSKSACLEADTPQGFDIWGLGELNVAVKNSGCFIHKFSTAL